MLPEVPVAYFPVFNDKPFDCRIQVEAYDIIPKPEKPGSGFQKSD
jgi:hypothetical protein